MKLNEEEQGQVQAMLHSVGWSKFQEYLDSKIQEYSMLEVPFDLGSLVLREQQLGKVEALKDLVPDFKITVKQIENQNHE